MRIIAQAEAVQAMFSLCAQATSRVRMRLRQAAAALPSDCPLCGMAARGGNLCPGCAADVLADAAHVARCPRCWLALPAGRAACPDCAVRPPAFARAVCAFDYLPPADALVHQLKAGMRLARAALLAQLIAQAVGRALPPLPAPTTLVPVPAATASLRKRGFNPAGEIARALGRELGLPVVPWLRRTREQGRQTHQGRLGRRRGARGLYACVRPVSGCVAVVDDVMTTGSTMDAAARALIDAGADSVLALAAARTPYQSARLAR